MTATLDLSPDLDLLTSIQTESEPFPYVYAQNFGNTRDWPLRSWAQMEHLAAGLGRDWETAFLVVHHTAAPRAAQLFGSAYRCLVEVLDGWNVWRAARVGQAGRPTTVIGAHQLVLGASTSEIMNAVEAVPIMRLWLEHGVLAEGFEFLEPAGID